VLALTSNDEYALQILQESGAVTAEQVEKARSAATVAQRGMSVVDMLIHENVLSEMDILGVLAGHLGMEMISLQGVDIPPEIRDMVPVEIARRYKVIPVYKVDNTLTVATSDPFSFDSLDSLRYVLKCNVDGAVTTRDEIKVALDRYYIVESTMDAMMEEVADGTVNVAIDGGAGRRGGRHGNGRRRADHQTRLPDHARSVPASCFGHPSGTPGEAVPGAVSH